jgi:hypothetical protein
LGVDLSDVNVDLGGSLGSVGPVTVAGIPSSYTISVQSLPKVTLGIDPITINKVQLGVDPVELRMSVEKIPDIRAHLPADFHVGLSLLGMELMCVRLCGEAQMITEPYVPNACERCGERIERAVDA